jgi:hypothetical protein
MRMNRIIRWLIGSKRYADYMCQFHKRDQTNIHRVAESLWYAQIASNYTIPIEYVGYDEENDVLVIMIDRECYEVSLDCSVVNEK